MVREHYELKRSRLSIVFQLLLLLIISLVIFLTIDFTISIMSLFGMLLGFAWFLARPQLNNLAHLDHNEWSLKFTTDEKIHRVTFIKMINHHFYVVIYFNHNKQKSVVIWKDQLDVQSWKRLIMRSHLS